MRGRFAPSPTGTLHLGNLRTALLAWLFARSAGSEVLLRFEDLNDAVRPEFYDAQRRDLERLGLEWDDELRQHEHLERYQASADQLVADGLTYRCWCTRAEVRDAAAAPHGDLPDGAYPGTCRRLTAAETRAHQEAGRRPALRLRAGGERISFDDRCCGPTSGLVDDFVLLRRDGVPAYNLVVVLDDAHQQVEEVVRADDLLSSTPRQLYLADLLAVPRPAHAHVPLVLNLHGDRLAKRDGAVTLDDRLALGESPEQVRSMLAASLGLVSPGERADLHDLTERFDPDTLPRTPWRLAT